MKLMEIRNLRIFLLEVQKYLPGFPYCEGNNLLPCVQI